MSKEQREPNSGQEDEKYDSDRLKDFFIYRELNKKPPVESKFSKTDEEEVY